MARGSGSAPGKPTDLYTEGMRQWFITLIRAIPHKLQQNGYALRELVPDLPELATKAISELDFTHANTSLHYNNSGKIDFIGNISTKCFVEIPKKIYEYLRPRQLNIQFTDLDADLIAVFISLVPEIKLMIKTSPNDANSTAFHLPIIYCPVASLGGKKETGIEALPTPPELEAYISNPLPLIFIVRKVSNNHINFNLVVNPYLTSFPVHLVDVIVAMFWDIVTLGKVTTSQLKATKGNLIRYSIAQGIALYPPPLEPVKISFPEGSKLFSILMEKLNHASFGDAFSLDDPSLLFPKGAPEVKIGVQEELVAKLIAVTGEEMKIGGKGNAQNGQNNGQTTTVTTKTLESDKNQSTTNTKTVTNDQNGQANGNKANNGHNTTSAVTTTSTNNPIRSLAIPTTLASQLILPNDISHKKVNQNNPQEQQDNIINNFPLFTMAPLGHVTSCYTSKYGIPRQPMLAPHSRAMINIRRDIGLGSNGQGQTNNNHNNSNLLDGLDQYSHLFVHFIFNDNYTTLMKEYGHDTALLQSNSSQQNSTIPQTTLIPPQGTKIDPNRYSPCIQEPLLAPSFLPQPIREPQAPPREQTKIDADLQPVPYVHNSGLGKMKNRNNQAKMDGNTVVQLGVTPGIGNGDKKGQNDNQGGHFTPKLSLVRSIFISAPRTETRPPKLQTSYTNAKDGKDGKKNGKGGQNNTKNGQNGPNSAANKLQDTLITGFSATRAPHRFNPIGQSLVKIESVDAENGIVYISGHDLLNNTLILDIKPLHLSDLPMYQSLCFPSWVHNSYTKQFNQLLKNSGVVNSPYGFTGEQMVLNGQVANLMQLHSMRQAALKPTPNSVKPLVLGATTLLNEGGNGKNLVSDHEQVELIKLLQKSIPAEQFQNILSQSPLLASFLEQSNLLQITQNDQNGQNNNTQINTTMADDVNATNSALVALEPDGFPAVAMCNEAACVQFDPLVLLYIQYCFWCQYNLYYSAERLSDTASTITTKLYQQHQAVNQYNEDMRQYQILKKNYEEFSMVPPHIPDDLPLPTHIPPRAPLVSTTTALMCDADGDNEENNEGPGGQNGPNGVVVDYKKLYQNVFEQDKTIASLPPPPQPPQTQGGCFIPDFSLFSSLIPLVPIPKKNWVNPAQNKQDDQNGGGGNAQVNSIGMDCPHIKDFNIAFTGETNTKINDLQTMYTSIMQLYGNHFKSNPFNSYSSYENIKSHQNGHQNGQTTTTTQNNNLNTSLITPNTIDDYLQSEYQSLLHTIIQTLSCDPRSHHAISKSQSIFSFQLDNFNISFQIDAEDVGSNANGNDMGDGTQNKKGCGCVHHGEALDFTNYTDLYQNLGEFQQDPDFVLINDSSTAGSSQQPVNKSQFKPYQPEMNPFSKSKFVQNDQNDNQNTQHTPTQQPQTRLNIRIFHIQYNPSNPSIRNPYSIPSRNRWLPSLYGFEWFLQNLLFATKFMPNPLTLQTIISSVQYQLFHSRPWYLSSLFYTADQPSLRSAPWLKDLIQHYPHLAGSHDGDNDKDFE